VPVAADTPRDVSAELYAILNAAQYEHEAKAAAWAVLEADRPTAAKLAELHAQGHPRALLGALAELLS
jgi:hypothetical protein